MFDKHIPNVQVQARLLQLAGLFLFALALALTLSPAARLRTLDADLRWEHWAGFGAWVVCAWLAHRFTARRLPDADPFILPIAALLAGWGLISIWRLTTEFGMRQTAWLAAVSLFLIYGIKAPPDLGFLRRYKYLWLTGGILLTALTFFFGSNPGNTGPRLWLGCCGIYLQPSEPLKLLLVIYLAAYFAENYPIQNRLLPTIFPTLVISGLALAILIIQRDLGTASIFTFLYCAMLYLASGRRRVMLVSFGLLALTALVGYFLIDIIQVRIDAWINPWDDPSGRSYQIIQSLLAIANGGLFGRGLGIGSPGLVPVAHSDFIFTSIAEETGMLGAFGLFLLIGIFVMRGFLIAIRAPGQFQRLLAAGLSLYIGAQSLVIIGGNLRMLPLTGVTLPFVSYGGSSLLTSVIALLLLLLISSESEQEPAPLRTAAPFKNMAGLIFAGLLSASLATGWWGVWRTDDLLARTDNARRAISDRFVPRGSILDRNNQAINTTIGEPGGYSRIYAYPALSSVVGYIHPIYGQSGIEAGLDDYLRGLRGNPALLIWWDHLLYGQPPAGLDVRLSIDLNLQKIADSLLEGRTGAVVLLNAQNGEILTMASSPSFDANQLDSLGETLNQDANSPLLNRATQGLYPLGTASNPFVAAAFGNESNPQPGELLQLYEALGFFSQPKVPLETAPAAPKADVENIYLSPLQMALGAAALGNGGQLPAPRLATSVNTSQSGWVILPAEEKSAQVFPKNKLEAAMPALAIEAPFWGLKNCADEPAGSGWFVGGTQPGWQGLSLAVAVVIEAPDDEQNGCQLAYFARKIGLELLHQAINH